MTVTRPRISLARWTLAAGLAAGALLSLPAIVLAVSSALGLAGRSQVEPAASARPFPRPTRARELADSIVGRSRERRGDADGVFYFERQVGYLFREHPLLATFDEVYARPDAAAIPDDVLARGEAVAQLYALALLRDIDPAAFAVRAADLTASTERVVVCDGCSWETVPVSGVVARIERGLSFAPREE